MADLPHALDNEPHFDWDFRPREDVPTGRGELELVRILVLEDDSKIWRLLRHPSGKFEIETNWPDDEDLVAVELSHRDIASIYSIAPEGKIIDLPSLGYGPELQVFRRISLAYHWRSPIRDDGLAPLTMSELASLLLELLWIRLSDDCLSIWTGGNQPISFQSSHYPEVHPFILRLMQQSFQLDSPTRPLDVQEDIRDVFAGFDLQGSGERGVPLWDYIGSWDREIEYADQILTEFPVHPREKLLDVEVVAFYKQREKLRAAAYRRVTIGEILSAMGQIDFDFRPATYWDSDTKYVDEADLWGRDSDVYPNEVEIVSSTTSVWWDREEVGGEATIVTAFKLDDDYLIGDEDIDEVDDVSSDTRIYYRVISSETSPVGTFEIGSSDEPLTLEELIDLIQPIIEDAWDDWYMDHSRLVQHLKFKLLPTTRICALGPPLRRAGPQRTPAKHPTATRTC